MEQYNVDEFVWFEPRQWSKWGISFPRERAFNLNAALCAEVGPKIHIAFHPTKRVLCLRKAEDDGGLKVPCSGSIKSAELSEKLLEAGFQPPLRFTVTQQDEYWFAVPVEVAIPDTVDVKKPAKQPRMVNPKRLLEGVK